MKCDKETIRKFKRDVDVGTSIKRLAEKYGISRSSVYRWIKTYCKRSDPSDNEAYIKSLHRKILRQSQAIEIFQHTKLGTGSPIEERIDAITALYGQYSLNLLCSTLDVPKATYYRATRESKETTYDIKRREMTPLIFELFNESKQTIGAAKIAFMLRERGHRISTKLVDDIMHKNGWFSMRGGSKKLYTQGRERMKNIIAQEFTVSRPNEVWVSDVTEIECKGFKYYICIILDLYARKILSLQISTRNSTQLTNRTLKKAYEQRQPQEHLILHTDRGCNFTSKKFNLNLRKFSIEHSYSAAGNPYDNSVCEAFFKTLKQEELYRHLYDSEEDMKKSIYAYITWYNTQRPHAYLKYRTPDCVEKSYWEKYDN